MERSRVLVFQVDRIGLFVTRLWADVPNGRACRTRVVVLCGAAVVCSLFGTGWNSRESAVVE